MNQALVRKLLADPSAHRIIRVSAEAEAAPARVPVPVRVAGEQVA
jgi:UDP-3-O-[3-hydroxymyristoyl] N-acetylglucosamine deacetylase